MLFRCQHQHVSLKFHFYGTYSRTQQESVLDFAGTLCHISSMCIGTYKWMIYYVLDEGPYYILFLHGCANEISMAVLVGRKRAPVHSFACLYLYNLNRNKQYQK